MIDMLFMVGVEKPQYNNEAWGIIVPVFERVGYGCFSAADEKEDILHQAKSVILEMAEEMLNDGKLLDELDCGYRDYTKDYPDYDNWFAIDVPVETLTIKPKRYNVSLPPVFVERVDSFWKSHASQYRDRSDFFAKAAEHEMAKVIDES